MTHYDIITKLVGPIQPLGDTGTDGARFDNLKAMTELVDILIFDIHKVAQKGCSHEGSVAKAGKYAKEFLLNQGIEA